MRKIIVFNLISIDGYFAGPKGDINWHIVDLEFNKFAIEQLKTFGTIIFGRTTFQLFESYWPNALSDPKTSKEDIVIAKLINNIEKIVYSKSLNTVNWENTSLFNSINSQKLLKLKQQKGRDIVIFGSGTIVQALTNLGLIDEFRLMLNPVILGKGKPLFNNIKRKLNLKLISSKTFKSGNILLYYKTIK